MTKVGARSYSAHLNRTIPKRLAAAPCLIPFGSVIMMKVGYAHALQALSRNELPI